MPYSISLSLIGLLLIGWGAVDGGWWWPVAWLGGNFLALGVAHACGGHRLFGKHPSGRLTGWSWFLFLPLLALTTMVYHALRRFANEPAWNQVNERLVIGRRLLAGEVPGPFENYVDLTSEFAEPRSIRESPGYLSVPILDGGAPPPEVLQEAISRLRAGRTFVHCAQGHGRTALFSAALLLNSGQAASAEEALDQLRAVRPGIRLNRAQRQCLAALNRSPR